MIDWIKATPERWIRRAMVLVALAVAAFAAIQSYQHIYALAIAGHEDKLSARLLPLSVDGLIMAASLIMLYSAISGKQVHPLARLMLISGIGATVAANVLFGLPFGSIAAITSAWPALAFVGTVEMLVILMRDFKRQPKAAKPAKPPKVKRQGIAARTRARWQGMPKVDGPYPGMGPANPILPSPVPVPVLTSRADDDTRAHAHAPARPRGKSSASSSQTGQRKPRSKATLDQALARYDSDLAAGNVPTQRKIIADMSVAYPKAAEIQRGLAERASQR